MGSTTHFQYSPKGKEEAEEIGWYQLTRQQSDQNGGLLGGVPPAAMSCSTWNCRGIGNPATVKELRDFARSFVPSVLCIVETQVHKTRVEGLTRTLGYDHAFAVSSSGRSGGLGMFWNDGINVEILPYSQYHIDAIFTETDGSKWRFTCVYGEAQTRERFKTWDMLKWGNIQCSHPLRCYKCYHPNKQI